MDYRKGQLVCSRAGRDKGRFLVVIDITRDRVLVADGKEHRLAKPKAKNPKHLCRTNRFVTKAQMATDKLLNRAIEESAALTT